MVKVHFHRTEHQLRWAWTDGLRTLEQQEIAVQLSWPEQDPRDKLVTHLFRFLKHYLVGQSKRIHPGQTLRYGWTRLRFVRGELHLGGAHLDALLIEEQQDPFAYAASSYISGIAQTMSLLQLQHEAMERNHVTGEALYPSSLQIALVCTRVTPETVQYLRPLMAHRAWQPTARESGWFLGCCDHEHDHDNPNALVSIHLSHLVKQFPGLFPYIAMPIGTQLLFQEYQAVIFHPGKQYGQVDPDRLLSSLPF